MPVAQYPSTDGRFRRVDSLTDNQVMAQVNVNLDRVTPDKPKSFSTLNGDIDVTLPPDTKATVKMETQNGSIFSDFEIQMNASPREPKWSIS